VQLAISHEGAIAAEVVRHGGARDLLRLVGIAQQELASRERPPIAVAIEGAVADLEKLLVAVWILAVENRIADPIGEAEMLLRRGLVLAILSRENGAQFLIPLWRLSRLVVSGEELYAAAFLGELLDLPGFIIEGGDRRSRERTASAPRCGSSSRQTRATSLS
jgi:hypothetical protein